MWRVSGCVESVRVCREYLGVQRVLGCVESMRVCSVRVCREYEGV